MLILEAYARATAIVIGYLMATVSAGAGLMLGVLWFVDLL